MFITVKGKEQEIKFTFNSFKYMEDFDIRELAEVDNKPFKLIGIAEQLILGGLNHNPKHRFSPSDVAEFLGEFIEQEGSVGELIENLILEMQESHFFKSLQKSAEAKAKAKK